MNEPDIKKWPWQVRYPLIGVAGVGAWGIVWAMLELWKWAGALGS